MGGEIDALPRWRCIAICGRPKSMQYNTVQYSRCRLADCRCSSSSVSMPEGAVGSDGCADVGALLQSLLVLAREKQMSLDDIVENIQMNVIVINAQDQESTNWRMELRELFLLEEKEERSTQPRGDHPIQLGHSIFLLYTPPSSSSTTITFSLLLSIFSLQNSLHLLKYVPIVVRVSIARLTD